MSYTYSRALVEEYLQANYSAIEPSAQSKSTPTPDLYLLPDKTTDHSRLSRYGMTFGHLTDELGEAVLTWFAEAFPAKTLAQPEKAQESTASAADCGESLRELSVRYSRATSSWKTHHCLWDEDLPESSVILPKWGSMRDGVLSERMTSAHRTSAIDCGLWPTPNCIGYRSDGELMLLAKKANSIEEYFALSSRACNSKRAKYWPTPTTSTGGPEPEGKTGRKLVTIVGGQLNPTWTEWLMGWPLEWTALKPSATDKFHSAHLRHGGC